MRGNLSGNRSNPEAEPEDAKSPPNLISVFKASTLSRLLTFSLLEKFDFRYTSAKLITVLLKNINKVLSRYQA